MTEVPRIWSSPTSRSASTLPGVGVGDAHLEARHGRAEQGEAPGALGALVDGGGVALGLEHPPVDAVGHAGPRTGAGNVPPIITSAMPKAGKTAPGTHAVRAGGGDELLDGVGVDRLGAVERDPQRRQVEARGVAQGPGGEHVGEVGAGGGGAAVRRQPLHPADRRGQEVLRRAEHRGRRRWRRGA